MAPMQLVKYPDPGLRRVARPVKRVDEGLLEAIPRMFEIMYRARGIGLAGPQAGLDRRIIVANLTGNPENRDQERVFIDPEIVARSGEKREDEGCLSFPGMSVVIARAEKVEVRYLDLEGREVRRDAEGLEAKLFQHEIDHLDGILIIDKMSPADGKQWAPFLKDLEKEYRSKARRRSSRSEASP